jgi:hypothetical protein
MSVEIDDESAHPNAGSKPNKLSFRIPRHNLSAGLQVYRVQALACVVTTAAT